MSSSSSATVISLEYAVEQFYLYSGFIVFITGVTSELFNVLIFTTLKTFRNTPCGFYLTVLSISNFGQMIVAVLIRTASNGLHTNFLQTSAICKIREFAVHYFALLSFTTVCLAMIDQFLSLIRPQWNSLHLAHRHIAVVCLFWLGHNIPFLIYYDVTSGSCNNLNNVVFANYVNYFIWPVLLGCLPITIMIVFSTLAFYNVRTLVVNPRNVIRLSHHRQLTKMTLAYVIFIIFLSMPNIIFNIYTLNVVDLSAEQSARYWLIYTILSTTYYESYACSFYIYCCVSSRFRKQVRYVLIDVHLKRWQNRVNRVRNNQIGFLTSHGEAKEERHMDVALY